MEEYGVDEDDLGILFGPWYREYEDLREGELLDQSGRHWEMHIHVRNLSAFHEHGCGAGPRQDTVIKYEDLNAGEMVDDKYPDWVDRFEDEFPEAELQYLDPDI